MWPFRSKPLLEPEMMDWMFEQADWLLGAHRHRAAFAQAQLLPLSARVFPVDGARGAVLAERLLAHVLRYSGAPWLQIALIATHESARFKADGPGPRIAPKSTAAGTYRRGLYANEISYDAALLDIPADLIAVLAHEVAHAILDLGSARPPPGDRAFNEMRTDFTATFLGFGFYLAQFRADTRIPSAEIAHEWKKLYIYYMNLREICFATALFATVRDVDFRLVLRRAPGAAVSHLKRAFADLAREADRVETLRASARRLATQDLKHDLAAE